MAQDIYGIINCYEEGKAEMKKKNFLKAARLFRMCRYYYEQGELNDLSIRKFTSRTQ